MTQPVTAKISDDQYDRIEELSEQFDTSNHQIHKTALLRGLDHLETNGGDKAVTDGGNPTQDPIPRLSQSAVQFFAGIAGALVFIQYTSGLDLTKYAAFSFTVAFVFALIHHSYGYLPEDAFNLRGDTA